MWSQTNVQHMWPRFELGDQVLLSMRKGALHHPSLRCKFARRWLGPCHVPEIVGRSAAKIQLPETLRQLHLHDVVHFQSLNSMMTL